MKLTEFYGHVKTFLDLIRLRNAFIAFAGVTIGALVFSLGSPVRTADVFTAAVSAALILAGGNALNDYFDVEIDRVNRPKRPIPSGRVLRSDALMVAFTMFLLGLGLAKSINDYCLAISLFNSAVLVVYAKYSKRMLLVSNLTISYLIASLFIYGAAAAHSQTVWVNPDGVKLTLVLSVCAFLLNLSREIIKDIEDLEGDKKAYSVTLPTCFGVDTSKKIAFSAALVTVFFSITPILLPSVGFNELLYGIVIIATDIIILSSYTTPPNVNQRLLIFSMTLALIAFLLGLSIQFIQPT